MAASSSSSFRQDEDLAPLGWHKSTLLILRDKKLLASIEEHHIPIVTPREGVRWQCRFDVQEEPPISFTSIRLAPTKPEAIAEAAAMVLSRLLSVLAGNLDFQRAWDLRYVPPQSDPPPDRAIWSLSPTPSWWSVSTLSTRVPLWTYLSRYPHDESRHIEFKHYLWDNKNIRDVAVKNVCAFLNSEGGKLFFGIRDDGTILGLVPPADNPQALDQLQQQLDADLRRIYPRPLDPEDNSILYTITIHRLSTHPDPEVASHHLASARSAIHQPPYPPVSETLPDNAIVLQIDVPSGSHPLYFETRGGVPAAWKRHDSSVHIVPPDEIIERLTRPARHAKEKIAQYCAALIQSTASL